MWIVQYALNRRYTIGVLAILILLFGTLSARRMPTDILPEVGIPSINLVWTYNGLSAADMAAKITTFSEAAILNTVDDLKEVRSETINGASIIRIDFQPNVSLDRALGQITAVSQTILRRMPPGTSPPLVVRNNVSSTPVLQLVLSSDSLTEAQLYDYARLQLRSQIQTIPGIRMTLPYGGAARQVMVDLNPSALQTYGLTPSDITGALERGSPTLPSGSIREGARELQISLDASPASVQEFLDLPVATRNGVVLYVRDVASVRDGGALQTNVARMDGSSAVSVALIKLGGASAVEIVRAVRERLPEIEASAPPGMRIAPIFDQSVFVDNAIASIQHEAVLVGLLVALVVLVFIGSWRSSLIVLSAIPLALLASVAMLDLLGYTFNVMTLGGLALAIGILVDNAVVDVENTNRNIALGKDVRTAILDSAREVVFPEFVSTVSICIVLTPILLMTGLSAWVFTPLALAVIFAMIASFLLSRTLIPVLCYLLLPADIRSRENPRWAPEKLLLGINHRVEHTLDALRDRHHALLVRLGHHGGVLAIAALLVVAVGVGAGALLGREYFPQVDAGQLRLQVRMPSGTRLEQTTQRLTEIQREIRRIIPAGELQTVYEQIGVPDAINLSLVDSAVVGSFEAELMLQLRSPHAPTRDYLAQIRQRMAERFPDVKVFERPPDATSRTLAGSAAAAFEVRLIGRDVPGNLALAREVESRLRQEPGAVDVALRQILDLPEYRVHIDRTRAAQLGLDAQQASRAVLSVLGTSGTVTPVYWTDTVNAIAYTVQVQAPPASLPDAETLLNMPLRIGGEGQAVLLRNIATVTPRNVPASIARTTLAPTVSVLANVQGTDLGSVYSRLTRITADVQARMKPGNRIEITGQAGEMQSAYGELAGGLLMSAVLVFLVLVINFQSWIQPLVAMSGLPVAIAGAAIGLFVTGTPLSVPALMGLMMVIGVSTANSVLVTSFARGLIADGHDPELAAYESAAVRLRPVLMTASAMVLGIIPMAIGLGDGGEQNAPLGRAVIGGLLFGTPATLVLVPSILAVVGRRQKRRAEAARAIDISDVSSPTATGDAAGAGVSP
ncbi:MULTISPECIES: efflux RND transporter permease subunit [unclassified Pseudoxanthomonas]|uniref:efflux RND transporter permease subunit n=1 Tax=unclassified Pseudoxanthomonas TaxID=2645906 RepID=UPI00160E7957|nr:MULTISPECIES: efflux RND transporter permease subunit [unclassified Pseudoxanthomonas]MBB3274952.1 multidrug efflux pump subunit AcrB [Pseudoxanthomonas sp. OG2]MBD9379281.1 efflux RND transporter permease subunit [Pseudoxanthomonas sp. PXM04]MBV7473955.1 efflux RND transporter permease subunit [Pseudoxanthomonas sp. PXM05]